MKPGFLHHKPTRSLLYALDPRAKILSAFVAIVLIVSLPLGQYTRFAGFYLLLAMLIALSGVSLKLLLSRCLLASPFVVLSAVFLALSPAPEAGITTGSFISLQLRADALLVASAILLKTYGAIILLTLLTATSSLHQLVWGLQRLGLPSVLVHVASLMHRYTFLLTEEWQRTSLARACRTPDLPRFNRFRLYGNQLALIFLRTWERSERLQVALLARGFDGRLSLGSERPLRLSDVVLCGVFLVAWIGVRVGGALAS